MSMSLSNVPPEILQHIVAHMGPRTQSRYARTSRAARNAVQAHRVARLPAVRVSWRRSTDLVLKTERYAYSLAYRAVRYALAAAGLVTQARPTFVPHRDGGFVARQGHMLALLRYANNGRWNLAIVIPRAVQGQRSLYSISATFNFENMLGFVYTDETRMDDMLYAAINDGIEAGLQRADFQTYHHIMQQL